MSRLIENAIDVTVLNEVEDPRLICTRSLKSTGKKIAGILCLNTFRKIKP